MQNKFVKVKDHHFLINGKPYYYVGANYWYGGILGTTSEGKLRVKKELDFLLSKGVTNLRILAAAEGEGLINGKNRVKPAYQIAQGVFDENNIKGLDFLLVEMGKRNLKAVIYFGNNWEWSGGFLQYLNWNNLLPDSIMQRKLTWDENRDYVSNFYSSKESVDAYNVQILKIVNRVNSISGKSYKNDKTIMAWELANEPRPMRPIAVENFIKWNLETSAMIKKADKHHLVTTGSEGEMGSNDMAVFKEVHASPNLDYATIHIWPKNWGWFKDTSINKSLEQIKKNASQYIIKHQIVLRNLNKPLVLEEFGLPRDLQSYQLGSPVANRDHYFNFILNMWMVSKKTNDVLAGCNFWAFGGLGRPQQGTHFWKEGADLLGDPPQEEQGLNSVFNNDTSTWKIIESFTKKNK